MERTATAKDEIDIELSLSPLCTKVLEGVAAGLSTSSLASSLYLSTQGVQYHVSALARKLKAANRTALVSRAYAAGILVPGSWPPRVAPDFVE